MFVQGLTAFSLTTVLLLLLVPLARHIGLVDHPGDRKQHVGDIPLTGGVGIFIALVLLLPWFTPLTDSLYFYLAAAGLLVGVGVLDDRFNLGVAARVVVEVVAALIMVLGADLWVGQLGPLVGFRELHLPLWLATPFTIIAVFGITNAWNMIDGMDGLLGVVSLIAFGSLYFLIHDSAQSTVVLVLLMGGVVGYLAFNIGANRLIPKVFLGDAGSKLLGFSLVWLLIDATQGGAFTRMHLPPVLALYIAGLPLIDMVVTTVRRMRKGQPPFRADRTHIHHVLEKAGFSRGEILLLVGVLMVQINFIGIVMYMLHWADWVQFLIFWLLTVLYYFSIEHAWRLGHWLQEQQGRRQADESPK